MPSSSSVAQACTTALSANSWLVSTANTCARSASVSLFAGVGRGADVLSQVVDGRVDHRRDRGGLSALSESVSKSALICR